MKKQKTILLCLVIVTLMSLTIGAAPYVNKQDKAHQIAELARDLNLPETDPIIVRAKELWSDADEEFCSDRDIIACVVYNEAWGDCTTEHRELVAAVIVNRVNAQYSGATSVREVVTARGQYLPAYATPGSTYWKRATADPTIWAECQRIATKALKGEIDCPSNVLYQSNYQQGKSVYKKFWACGNWTYFCYG